MKEDKIDYIIRYHEEGIPLSVLKNLKYPFLTTEEYKKEKEKVANTIVEKYPDKIHFNNCPNCGKLARTPYAKQCRFCGNDWH